jgi:hypothetical protein
MIDAFKTNGSSPPQPRPNIFVENPGDDSRTLTLPQAAQILRLEVR